MWQLAIKLIPVPCTHPVQGKMTLSEQFQVHTTECKMEESVTTQVVEPATAQKTGDELKGSFSLVQGETP